MTKTVRLDCGATLIMENVDYVRSAALGIWVKSGSVFEETKNNGVSHFIEHMMFKGTEKRTAKGIAEDIDRIGASSNAFTGKEATCYYIKALSTNIVEGADILLDMVVNSTFDEVEIDRERKVILEEIKMVRDCPDDDVYETISELVNNGSPLSRSILGTPESLDRIGRSAMKEYYSERYTTENIVVAVAGNFNEDDIIRLFDEKLMPLRGDRTLDNMKTRSYSPAFDVKVKEIEQTHICLATPSVPYDHELYHAFVLMNNIFGGSMSSRLFQNIREQKGLAYSVCSMNNFNSFGGFFNIYAGVAHDKAGVAVREIRNELEKLAEHGVTAEELAKSKQQVESSYIFSLENITTLMWSLGRNKLLMDRIFSVDESLEKFSAVSREDILKAAAMVGDSRAYSGAAVTGNEINLKKMVSDAD